MGEEEGEEGEEEGAIFLRWGREVVPLWRAFIFVIVVGRAIV